MPLQRTLYEFSVRLPAPRERAFRWATEYRSTDLDLMGEPGHRTVEKLAKNMFLLTDVFETPRGHVTKSKLVHLLPGRHAWTSTHVAGPARYSQFLYELRPGERNGCRLHFTGLQVDRVSRRATPRGVIRRAKELARDDSRAWRRLADAMARELR
jgi:hypothetical protein